MLNQSTCDSNRSNFAQRRKAGAKTQRLCVFAPALRLCAKLAGCINVLGADLETDRCPPHSRMVICAPAVVVLSPSTDAREARPVPAMSRRKLVTILLAVIGALVAIVVVVGVLVVV